MAKRIKKPTIVQQIMAEVESRLKAILHDSTRAQYLRHTKAFVRYCGFGYALLALRQPFKGLFVFHIGAFPFMIDTWRSPVSRQRLGTHIAPTPSIVNTAHPYSLTQSTLMNVPSDRYFLLAPGPRSENDESSMSFPSTKHSSVPAG